MLIAAKSSKDFLIEPPAVIVGKSEKTKKFLSVRNSAEIGFRKSVISEAC
jgi:hypothetical protein